MVRANRPWRLAVRLYAALVAALAASIFGVVDLHVWQIAATMAWWRLTIMSITSISLTITAVIVVHGLWERAPDPRVREQVVLFNIATAVTVAIGILCLYVALFVLILAASALVISPDLLTETVHRRVRAGHLCCPSLVRQLARDRRRRARRPSRVRRGRPRGCLCHLGNPRGRGQRSVLTAGPGESPVHGPFPPLGDGAFGFAFAAT
jgi:hypothetical protein